MVAILENKAELKFNQYKKWYYFLLSTEDKLMHMYTWFVTCTNVKIDIRTDITSFGYTFDYFVQNPSKDEVLTSKRDVNKNPFVDFEKCMSEGLIKAGNVYNATN